MDDLRASDWPGFEPGDFSAPRMGDRFTARSALNEGKRLKDGEEREPNRVDRCHGYANCCMCPTCSLPPDQRRLRRRLGIAVDPRKEAA